MISSAILNVKSIPYLRQPEEHVSVRMGPTNHGMIMMPINMKEGATLELEKKSHELVWNEIRFNSLWVEITLPWSWFKWPPSQSYLLSLILGSSERLLGAGLLASILWSSCIYTDKLKVIIEKDIIFISWSDRYRQSSSYWVVQAFAFFLMCTAISQGRLTRGVVSFI